LCEDIFMSHRLLLCLTNAAWLAILALAVTGCEPSGLKLYPVRGELFHEGKPAAGAFVLLTPENPGEEKDWPFGYPRANVNPDGSFEVGTLTSNDGAPEGKYKVTVTWMVAPPGAKTDDPEAATIDKLQGKYRHPAKSALSATVAPSPQPIVLPRIDLP
jgi:hypothetical protein